MVKAPHNYLEMSYKNLQSKSSYNNLDFKYTVHIALKKKKGEEGRLLNLTQIPRDTLQHQKGVLNFMKCSHQLVPASIHILNPH